VNNFHRRSSWTHQLGILSSLSLWAVTIKRAPAAKEPAITGRRGQERSGIDQSEGVTQHCFAHSPVCYWHLADSFSRLTISEECPLMAHSGRSRCSPTTSHVPQPHFSVILTSPGSPPRNSIKPSWKRQAKRSSVIWKAAKRPRPLASRRRKLSPNSANAQHARDLVLCLAALVR
jgi:hypothetical protein